MAKRICSPSDITASIQNELSVYSKEITKKMKKRAKDVADECKKGTKKDSPKRTGAYSKDWVSVKEYEDSNNIRYRIKNKKHYQLTHLLEYGHNQNGAIKGGRVEGKAHIKPNEEIAKKKILKGLQEDIRASGRGD